MDNENIHKLFETRDYIQLYHTQTVILQEMLLIDSQKDFEDFLGYHDCIEEEVFWLYYSVMQGESLLIGGYDGDVSKIVAEFLKQKLPKDLFRAIEYNIQKLYVDLGTINTIEEQIAVCNQHLRNTTYSLSLCYNESYCAGVYFLKVNVDIDK